MSDPPENLRGTARTNTRPNTDKPSDQTNMPTSKPQNPNQSQTQPQPSLASRIQSSATGLARSAFASDPSAAQTLAGVTSGKAGGGTVSGSSTGSASQDLSAGSGISSGAGSRAGTQGRHEGFREHTGAGTPSISGLTLEEFEQQDIGLDLAGQNQGEGNENAFQIPHEEYSAQSSGSLQSDSGSWKGKARAQDPVQAEYTNAWERANETAKPAGAESDGAAVAALLSDTSFDAGFGLTDPSDPHALETDIDPYAPPPPLTKEELEFLDSFRRQENMGTDMSPITAVQQNTALSLVPDIATFLRKNDAAAYVKEKGRSVSHPAVMLLEDVLASLPGASDWAGVQENYHEEVWGYLRSDLEAAKEEIEEGRDQDDYENDGPAVRRLKMILKHMKDIP